MISVLLLQLLLLGYLALVSHSVFGSMHLLWPSEHNKKDMSRENIIKNITDSKSSILIFSLFLLLSLIAYYSLLIPEEQLAFISLGFVLLTSLALPAFILASFAIRLFVARTAHKGICIGALVLGFFCVGFQTYGQLHPPEWHTSGLDALQPLLGKALARTGAWQPMFFPITRRESPELSAVREESRADRSQVKPHLHVQLLNRICPDACQLEAMLQHSLVTEQIVEGLDGSGSLNVFMPSKELWALYNPQWGINFSGLRLRKVLGWQYAGPPTHRNSMYVASSKTSRTVKNYFTYDSDSPKDIKFSWDTERIAPWAKKPEIQKAFPVIREILRDSDSAYQIARIQYESGMQQISGIVPWGVSDALPSSLLLRSHPEEQYRIGSSLLASREYREKKERRALGRVVIGHKEHIVDAVNLYLAKYCGFVLLNNTMKNGKDLQEVLSAYAEPQWEPDLPLDPERQRRQAEADEFQKKYKKSSLHANSELLRKMNSVSREMAKLNHTLSGIEVEREEQPLETPVQYEPDNPENRRFALFGLDAVKGKIPMFTLPEPDGWTYCQILFTYKVRQKARWADDSRCKALYPYIQKLIDGAGTRECLWIVRWRASSQKTEAAGCGMVYEVVYSKALASGI